MKELLLLTPTDLEKHKPTKILDKSLNKLKSFDSGYLFNFETLEYEDLHEALKIVFSVDSCFLVLGELTEFGRECAETGNPSYRRKKEKFGKIPTIQDKTDNVLVLDLDDHVLPKFDALNPEPAIKKWLKDREINCDVTYQITSGQKLNTEEARIRLYFNANKNYSLLERKAWAQSPSIGADGSVYTCSQPIYTASPIIEGATDPIRKRIGFLKGSERAFTLPAEILTKENVEKYSGFHRSGEIYDYSSKTLPEEVLSGKVYRRYFMPLAFHYANLLKGDKDAIFSIIEAKSLLVKNRDFDADNVWEYITDACSKIDSETEAETAEIQTKDDIADFDIAPVPEFPIDIMETWPAPWPMLWENFKQVPRVMEEALLVPTVLSLNAYFLRCQYITAYGRRPNMFFLNLTPSTGNKDVNSKNVIRDLSAIFRKRLGAGSKSIFSGILNTESSITADTTFLQSFSENGELFWINTEATRIFQQIKNSGGNSNVAALSDKLIELVDGHEITGKVKAAGKVKTIENPNAQVLFYAQPETIERYIDEEMVDSGLFGRSLLSIVPTLSFDVDSYEMFMERDSDLANVSDEFFDFYHSEAVSLGGISDVKTVLKPDIASLAILNAWAREYVAPLMKDDEALQKVLSRVGNSAEQLYCIVLGICRKYDSAIGKPERKKINVSTLIPLLEYWVDCKVYAIKNYINSSLDPLADAVIEIIRQCIAGKYKMPSNFDAKAINEHHCVPMSQFYRVLKCNTKIVRQLSGDGDKRNAIERVDRILKVFIGNGVLIKKTVKIGNSTKECIGIKK